MKSENNKGFGLLELMLSMVIVALLLIMATRYYASAHTSARINDAVSQVSAVVAAANEFAIGSGGYSTVSSIDNLKALLPNHSIINPWNNPLAFASAPTASQFVLNIVTDNADSCNLLANALTSSTSDISQSSAVCNAASSTVAYTYNYVYTPSA